MDIRTLRLFFMWCTIVNGVFLLVWTLAWTFAPDWFYAVQGGWFPWSKEAFMGVMYAFVGFFKILILVFNFVPFVALVIVGRNRQPRVTNDE